jgi:hypothetical protein
VTARSACGVLLRIVRRAAFVALPIAGALPAQADDSSALLRRDDWSFSIAPYVWAAALEGDVAVPGLPSIAVDASFGDILRHLDFAAMTFVELRYRRFGAYGDIVLTNISVDADPPGGLLFDDADLRTELFIGTFGGSYRVLERERGSLDLLAGARVWSVDTRVELDGDILSDREVEDNQNWVDPVVGLKGRLELGRGVALTGLAHVGGFGAGSDLTWDAFGGINYAFNDWVSAIAGYRHLEVDRDNGAFQFDAQLTGPVIGATIRF